MPLYEKKLQEVARGEYEGPYTLVMPGDWRFVIVVTTKKGDTSTQVTPGARHRLNPRSPPGWGGLPPATR